jgi:hypothetical protein
MPAPYAILEASTVLVGLVGSLIVILVISMDSWEEADFSFTPTNTSYLQISVASSRTDVTMYNIRASLTDAWSTYYYYYQYWGLWRICDLLTGWLNIITHFLLILSIIIRFPEISHFVFDRFHYGSKE